MKRIIGKINPAEKQVNIWGAGFSGLILGHYLKGLGYKVTIYEKSNKVGGKIQTKKNSVGIVEKAANALFMNADGMDLLKELGLEPLPANKKIKRLLLINGKPRRPFQLSIVSKFLVHANKKPPLISDGLTVAEFFRPLVGQENIQKFFSPILGGIYATTAEHLHFRSVFDELAHVAQFESYWDFFRTLMKNMKAKPKLDVMGSVSFEGGMQTFIQRLAESLKNDIKLNSKESFKLKGNTIICTDALSASQLLKEVRPELSTELARIKYQELSTFTVFTKREIRSLSRSFGVVIPRDQGYSSIGVLNNKATFPSNYPNVFSYTFITPKKCSEEDIKQDIKLLSNDLSDDDIEAIESTYWEHALPIYDIGRYLSIKKLHLMAQEENLAIFGNYVAGISLREMISAARSFVLSPQDYQDIK